MGGWASAAKQAKGAIKELQKAGELRGVSTGNTYEKALKNVASWVKSEHREGRGPGDLQSMTRDDAMNFLEQRGQEVGQSQLNQERQAVQLMQQKITGHLSKNEKLHVTKSQYEQKENVGVTKAYQHRGYTRWQVDQITLRQSYKNGLSTQIAAAAGLRAHELITLRPASEQPADVRPTRDEKFSVRSDHERYTVQGKGGLTREVMIPKHLAERLEARRFEQPQQVKDRDIFYQKHYDIGSGNAWSKSFTQASQRALERSNGAHGVRHSYAQDRLKELQVSGLSYVDSLEVVSQEMGHFRPDISETYLR